MMKTLYIIGQLLKDLCMCWCSKISILKNSNFKHSVRCSFTFNHTQKVHFYSHSNRGVIWETGGPSPPKEKKRKKKEKKEKRERKEKKEKKEKKETMNTIASNYYI